MKGQIQTCLGNPWCYVVKELFHPDRTSVHSVEVVKQGLKEFFQGLASEVLIN